MQQSPVMESIAYWAQEEKGAQNQRYFCRFRDVADLEQGRKCFVVGRKGAGKTAIAEHVHSMPSHDLFVRKLSFRRFPYHLLYRHKDQAYPKLSLYITLWKYLIYSTVCHMMSLNEAIDGEIAAQLREAFPIDPERALSDNVRQLTEQGGGFKLLSTGADYRQKAETTDNTTPMHERVRILEDLIELYGDESRYFVLFDELDDDLSSETARNDSDYIQLITSLFKAVADVRAHFSETRRVYPIVFLRHDILDLIRDNDKNKWRDDTVLLDWDLSRLKTLLCHRIARAEAEDACETADALDKAFSFTHVDYGRDGKQRREVLKHIARRTFLRPRDMIVYLKSCAEIALEEGEPKISVRIMNRADERYSDYFRQEIIDEVGPQLENVDEVLNLLGDIGKPTFSRKELRACYNEYVKQQDAEAMDFDRLCELLFEFSIIGRQHRVGERQVFRYMSRRARLKQDDILCLHRGLQYALDVY